MIHDTKAIRYRPVFIYLEIKHPHFLPAYRENEEGQGWGIGTLEERWQRGIDALNEVFPSQYILLDEYLKRHQGQYPTVHEIVGKAIVYFPNPEFESAEPPFHGTLRDSTVFRLDQYELDWTFSYGVPPNPLVVDERTEDIGMKYGTYRFPYKTVGQAVKRAEGKVPASVRRPSVDPNRNSEINHHRSGYGWTVLLRPGHYAENVTIDIPLTLKKDDHYPGTVVIGTR